MATRTQMLPPAALARCAALFLAAAAPASAQRVYWQQPLTAFTAGEDAQLTLIFENCSPKDGVPRLPKIDGLDVLDTLSRAEQNNIVNGRYARTIMFSYGVRPARGSPIRLPALLVQTDKGPMTVAGIQLEVGGGDAALKQQVLAAILRPQKQTVWLGEVFPVEFLLLRHANAEGEVLGAGNIEWEPEGLTIEGWSQPADITTTVAGQPYIGWRYTARCAATRTGVLTLPESSIKIRTQRRFTIMSIITSVQPHDVTVTAAASSIEVKALPHPEPAGFTGAVGAFRLSSKVVPKSVSVGEPITWTLELAGNGNWDANFTLPARDVSTDFRVHQPKARLDQHENIIFDGTLTEDVVLIPTLPGAYTLEPVAWSFFNPMSGTYETLNTERAELTVTQAPQQAPGPAGPAAAADASPGPAAGKARPTKRPPQPSFDPSPRLPREPLTGTASALRPIGAAAAWLCLVPAVALALLWTALARRRAMLTDALAWRRAARQSLLDVLAKLPLAPRPEQRRPVLIEWMKHAAQFWGLRDETPSGARFLAALRLEHPQNPAAIAGWERLWREAEAAAYAAGGRLPDDWAARAKAALLARTVPNPPVWHLFLARNAWPLLACAAALLAPAASRADDGIAAYRAGDFARAEASFAERIAKHPTDWKARNNLALALAQQERWTEAAAYWTSARILNPRDPAVAWNLAIAREQAGLAPASSPQTPPITRFLDAAREALDPTTTPALGPSGFFAVFSPAQWQWLLVAAAVLAAAGLAPVLLARYRGKSGLAGRAALAAPALALLLAAASGIALAYYGPFANRMVAIVATPAILRSIPTDLESQKTKDLPAGTPVIVVGEFLGWRRVRLSNAETGWTRAAHLVPVYAAPAPKRESQGAAPQPPNNP